MLTFTMLLQIIYIRNSYNVSPTLCEVNNCIFEYDVLLGGNQQTDFPQDTDEKLNKHIG